MSDLDGVADLELFLKLRSHTVYGGPAGDELSRALGSRRSSSGRRVRSRRCGCRAATRSSGRRFRCSWSWNSRALRSCEAGNWGRGSSRSAAITPTETGIGDRMQRHTSLSCKTHALSLSLPGTTRTETDIRGIRMNKGGREEREDRMIETFWFDDGRLVGVVDSFPAHPRRVGQKESPTAYFPHGCCSQSPGKASRG